MKAMAEARQAGSTAVVAAGNAQLLAFLKSLDGKPNPFFCTTLPCADVFNLAQTLPQVNAFNSYAVTEKTLSGYLQADFSTDRWSGNIGLRMVHTKTTADTASAQGNGVDSARASRAGSARTRSSA